MISLTVVKMVELNLEAVSFGVGLVDHRKRGIALWPYRNIFMDSPSRTCLPRYIPRLRVRYHIVPIALIHYNIKGVNSIRRKQTFRVGWLRVAISIPSASPNINAQNVSSIMATTTIQTGSYIYVCSLAHLHLYCSTACSAR
jgi:hypothetical protein